MIVYRLTKSAHFIPVKATYLVEDYDKFYLKEIVRMHAVPLSIISDRGTQLNSHVFKLFQSVLGTKVKHNTAFDPQKDDLVERTTKTIEDMLRSCVINFKGNWDYHLPLVKFSNNNDYHLNISIEPFEALYGRRCQSPIGWFNIW